MLPRNKKTQGFTLIELLTVLGIISVLATFAIINFSGAQKKARDAVRKSDLKNIQTALRLYYNNYGEYPAHGTGGVINACGGSCTSGCSWNSNWSCGSTVYMGNLPGDPGSGTVEYRYTKLDDDNYTLEASLENTNDSAIAESQARCMGTPEVTAYVCLSHGSACTGVSNCLSGCYVPANPGTKSACDNDCIAGTAAIGSVESGPDTGSSYFVCP